MNNERTDEQEQKENGAEATSIPACNDQSNISKAVRNEQAEGTILPACIHNSVLQVSRITIIPGKKRQQYQVYNESLCKIDVRLYTSAIT